MPSQPIMLAIPPVYLGRRGADYVFRFTVRGNPVVAHYPVSLVDPWRPHSIDRTAVAYGDEGPPPSVAVSEGEAALGKLVEDGVEGEREKEGAVALTANEILADGTIAR